MHDENLSKVRSTIVHTFGINTEKVPDVLSVDTVDRWDSIGHLELILNLQDTFGIKFAPDETIRMLSEEAILEILRQK